MKNTDGDPALRYTFRTAPLRNLKVAPAIFHNDAFGTLEAAIAHHLDVKASLQNYDPDANNAPLDLFPGPFAGILAAGIDPLLKDSDPAYQERVPRLGRVRAPRPFRKRVLKFGEQIPKSVPSGMALQFFERCE